MHVLVPRAAAGEYGSWIELGDVVDVYIKSVALFKFNLPLQRYSSIHNKESKTCLDQER